jgi:hypothetical protein
MVKFGAQPHQQLEPDTAGRLLEALFREAPGVFGYFLAVAVTGVAPSRPRASHQAPDLQQPAGPGPRLVTGGQK